MKKNLWAIGFLILVSIIMIPSNVLAEELDLSKYKSESLEEAFQKENITSYDLSNYQETEDRATIYLFRLDGCGNCKNFLNYVASKLLVEHGEKFKVVSYEMKNDPLNLQLRTVVQSYLGEDIAVTPYIIIGEKTFSGFIDSTKQKEIEDAIVSLYNAADKYDVFEDILNNKKVFSDGGITFSSQKGLDKNYSLKVTEIDKKEVSFRSEYDYITAYDITMYNGGVVVPLSNGSFEIRIPVTAQYDSYKVAYLNNDTIHEVLDARYENGYVIFTTTHLSEYAIYGTNHDVEASIIASTSNSNSSTIKNPATGDFLPLFILMTVGGLLSTIILGRKMIKKTNVIS